jgi:O-antigen ligase
MGALFFDRIVAYAARGNGVKNIVTLSDRTYVWQASWKAFLLRPILGYGAVKGVSNAIKDQWVFTHWVPPECHNEILQALVSGGILAGVLVLFLFVQIIWKGFRIRAYGEKQTFLLVVLLEVTFVGIGNAVISGGFARSSALFLLAFVGVSGSYSRVRASLKARKQRLVYIGHQSSQPVSA